MERRDLPGHRSYSRLHPPSARSRRSFPFHKRPGSSDTALHSVEKIPPSISGTNLPGRPV